MRDRALLLCLIGACLLSLLVAYWQHDSVQRYFREAEQLTAQNRSTTWQLRAAVEKNVELSRQITRLAEESSRHKKSAADAREAKQKLEATVSRLEATLVEKGAGGAALEEKIASLEAAVSGLVTRLDEEHEAAGARIKELAALVASDAAVLKELDGRLTSLPEKVEELGARLAQSLATPEAAAAPVLEELARLQARLDEHRTSLQGLNKKVEILGRMLAVGRRPAVDSEQPPPAIEATVAAVDPARNEVALNGDLDGLQPGHSVWISRDRIAVARAEVFRVDAAARLAAARVAWTLPGASIQAGDRVTASPPDEPEGPVAPERPVAPEGEAGSSEKDGSDSGGERGESSKGPISPDGAGSTPTLIRPRPPPPPPRPDADQQATERTVNR